MPKNKKELSNKQLEEIIFANIFQVVDDETGNSSYRKYFDKVLNDIFGLSGVITTFMMTPNQFKAIHKMMNDPELKPFCQMMLRENDVNILREMVRVAYDAAQIALKPKKSVSSGDIKAYRYLSKLYTEGIKTLRKKYGQSKSEKKKYKDKYTSLSSMLGKKTTPTYNLSLLDDSDDDFTDIFDDEDDEDDSRFDMNEFDLDDLPTRFMISNDDLWKPPVDDEGESDRKSFKYVSDDDTEDTEDENLTYKSSEDLVMPEGQFQRYAISIFERLLQGLDKKNEADENSMNNREATDMEDSIIPDPDPELPFEESAQSDSIVTNGLVNNQIEIPSLQSTSIVGTSHDSVTLEEIDPPTKDYKDMTREECINEFNKNSGVAPKSESN